MTDCMNHGGTIGGKKKEKKSNYSSLSFSYRAHARTTMDIVNAVLVQAGDGQIGRDLEAIVEGAMTELNCEENFQSYWKLLCLQLNLNTFFNLAEYVSENAVRCGFMSPASVFCHMANLIKDRFRGSWTNLGEFVAYVRGNFYAPSKLDEIDAAVDEEIRLTGGKAEYRPILLYANLKRGIAAALDHAYEALSLARQGYAHTPSGLFYSILTSH